jgi:hypothetical protein
MTIGRLASSLLRTEQLPEERITALARSRADGATSTTATPRRSQAAPRKPWAWARRQGKTTRFRSD